MLFLPFFWALFSRAFALGMFAPKCGLGFFTYREKCTFPWLDPVGVMVLFSHTRD